MIIELKAADRRQAIDELIDHLVVTGRIKPEHRDAIASAVQKRESSMSTGIGYGIAIPHASSELVCDVVGMLGRSKKGIDFDALDKQLVHSIFLFVVPQGQFQKHLQTLANIAKLLHRADFRQSLEQAPDAEAMLKIINEREDIGHPKPTSFLPHKLIQQRLQQAVLASLPDADVSCVLVRPCPDPKFGDYQTNALISLAKARKLNPRQLATDVLAKLDVSEWCEKVEIAVRWFLEFPVKTHCSRTHRAGSRVR